MLLEPADALPDQAAGLLDVELLEELLGLRDAVELAVFREGLQRELLRELLGVQVLPPRRQGHVALLHSLLPVHEGLPHLRVDLAHRDELRLDVRAAEEVVEEDRVAAAEADDADADAEVLPIEGPATVGVQRPEGAQRVAAEAAPEEVAEGAHRRLRRLRVEERQGADLLALLRRLRLRLRGLRRAPGLAVGVAPLLLPLLRVPPQLLLLALLLDLPNRHPVDARQRDLALVLLVEVAEEPLLVALELGLVAHVQVAGVVQREQPGAVDLLEADGGGAPALDELLPEVAHVAGAVGVEELQGELALQPLGHHGVPDRLAVSAPRRARLEGRLERAVGDLRGALDVEDVAPDAHEAVVLLYQPLLPLHELLLTRRLLALLRAHQRPRGGRLFRLLLGRLLLLVVAVGLLLLLLLLLPLP
mmetsp:Transcript_3590/g.7251  ORF Transcript_3590/g.7251 Transcript_3590/m.7251 type:complete len:419 (+) Transcript_3590:480-1736(+)